MKDNKSLIFGLGLLPIFGLGVFIAWAGSQNGMELGGWPLYALVVALVFLVQWIVYIPSQIAKTERFYDITASLTYASISLFLLIVMPDKNPRSILLGLVIIIWALRLGTFLFIRVSKAGSDDRFDELIKAPVRFLFAWTTQGLWITAVASAGWIAMTSDTQSDSYVWLVVGLVIWAIGFAIEVTADMQKSRFKANPANKGKFISTGIWSWSQHPNYFGEIALWTGVAIAAFSNFSGWQFVGFVSPIFTLVLLTKGSGIPLLQKKGQAKWGDDPAYQAYLKNTSLLVPLPPKK